MKQAEQEQLRKEEGQVRLRSLYSLQEEVLQLNQQVDGCLQSAQRAAECRPGALQTQGSQLCVLILRIILNTLKSGYCIAENQVEADLALQEMQDLLLNLEQEITRVSEMKKKDEEDFLAKCQESQV